MEPLSLPSNVDCITNGIDLVYKIRRRLDFYEVAFNLFVQLLPPPTCTPRSTASMPKQGDVLAMALLIALAVGILCAVLGVIFDDYSWIDRLW